MSKKVIESICEIIGEVRRLPESIDDDGGKFIRVRVLVDITLPLCRGRVITLENGEKSWVRFQYERLPNMCYWCGRLNHDDKECELWIQSRGSLTTDQQQFGSYLRATPFQTGGKNVFFVLGYFDREHNNTKKHNRTGETEEVSSVVGSPMVVPVERQTIRVCIDGEDSIDDVSVSTKKPTSELGKDWETAELNSQNSSLPNLTLLKNQVLTLNENKTPSQLADLDETIKCLDSGSYKFEASATTYSDHVDFFIGSHTSRDGENKDSPIEHQHRQSVPSGKHQSLIFSSM